MQEDGTERDGLSVTPSPESPEKAHTRYRFPLVRFDLNDPYHRWLVSLSHAINDAQLFSHLWSRLTTRLRHTPEVEPADIENYESRSLFYHAMAHTFEALTLFFSQDPAIGMKKRTNLSAVYESERNKSGKDLNATVRTIRRQWEDVYKDHFKSVRNLMVAHYADPVGSGRSKDDVSRYWQSMSGFLAHCRANAIDVAEGSIVIEDRYQGTELVRGRYRNNFVDVLQDAYLDKDFAHAFWGSDPAEHAAAYAVAAFMDETISFFNQILVPLLVRLIREQGDLVLQEQQWNEKAQRWEP